MIRALALAGLALAIAAAAAADSKKGDSDLDRALAGRSPGAPQKCIDISASNGQQIIDETTILFRSGRHVWRNTLMASCPTLRPGATLISEPFGSQVCQGDPIRALDPGSRIPGPWCRLGAFVPYDKAKP